MSARTVETQGGVVKLAAKQAELEAKRARLGIPSGGSAASADTRELIARLVPSVRTARWFNEGSAPPSPEPREPLTPSGPQADAKKEAKEIRGDSRRKSSKGTTPKRDEMPEVDATPAEEDSRYPLIPAGDKYEVRLARVVLKQMWNRWVWVCWWGVVEGDHAGVELPMYLPRPPKDRESRLSRGWAMSAAYAVATGRRPPKNLARLNPGVYLANKQFLVKVISVERDQHGADVPAGARYSKVKCLLRPSPGRGHA